MKHFGEWNSSLERDLQDQLTTVIHNAKSDPRSDWEKKESLPDRSTFTEIKELDIRQVHVFVYTNTQTKSLTTITAITQEMQIMLR